MTRWSLTDHHVHLLDEYMNFSGIPFVIELSLDNNFLGPEAAAVLASNIDDWKGGLHNIELFNIRGNQIGDDGGVDYPQLSPEHGANPSSPVMVHCSIDAGGLQRAIVCRPTVAFPAYEKPENRDQVERCKTDQGLPPSDLPTPPTMSGATAVAFLNWWAGHRGV